MVHAHQMHTTVQVGQQSYTVLLSLSLSLSLEKSSTKK
jgi:hypothetical protein